MYVGPQVGSLVDLQRYRAGAKGIAPRCPDSGFPVLLIVGQALRQQHDRRERHLEDGCDAPDRAPGRICPPRLDVGDPGRVDLGQVPEFFLAEATLGPQATNRPPKSRLRFFARCHPCGRFPPRMPRSIEKNSSSAQKLSSRA